MATRCDWRAAVAAGRPRTAADAAPAASHAALVRSVTIRLMLNAALAKTKSASTFGSPRSFTFRTRQSS